MEVRRMEPIALVIRPVTRLRATFAGLGTMQPLTPDDLLIRHKPLEDSQWINRLAPGKGTFRDVPLERFQVLERQVREIPLTEDPYLELARIYLHRGRWQDAKRILDLAIERFPDSEDVNYLREEAQLNRALQLVEEAQQELRAEPTRLTREKLQRCEIELNVLREKVCRQRLQRHPDQVALQIPLAAALEYQGRIEEAIDCLRQASDDPPLRAQAALQLGRLLERVERIPEALSAYRRAALFRRPPPQAEIRRAALEAAADLAERYSLVDSARRYVEMLLEIEPDDAVLRLRLQKLLDAPL
ncbi:MAG: hypothetical protein D6753_04815 [Planctomycetota bacterium]|nr:MAG: hypothetical protein D6753_04815 [Planctomycetota bacterium]